MQPHRTSRTYTPKALEAWFRHLEFEWEQAFTRDQLERGRKVYVDGEVRALELTDREAIIYRRQEKIDEYAVIEWRDGRPHLRFSMADTESGHALAVAGLHEIEELVGDEIPVLPAEPSEGAQAAAPATAVRPAIPASLAHPAKPTLAPTPPRTSGGGPYRPAGLAAARSPGNGFGHGASAPGSPARGATADGPARASRQLFLRFIAREDGLVFNGFWQSSDGREVSVFGAADEAAKGRTLEERKLLLNLAAFARKARFRFSTETRDYVLPDIKQVPEFIRRSLPEWRKQFTIEVSEGVRRLGDGATAVSLRARARAADGGGLNLKLIFEAGERLLTSDEARRLQASPTGTLLLPDIGLVALPPARAVSLGRWKQSIAELPEKSPLPNYMVFSLFQQEIGGLALPAELEEWKRRLMSAPAPRELPEILRPYQRRGVEWLAHLAGHDCHGLLADEMGLGKTVQVLALIASRPVREQSSLIVCPASVIPVWKEEIERRFPQLKVELLRGNRTFADVTEPVLWLSSYAQLRRQRPLLDVVEFGYAVLDEAQFIKNPEAKVTQACFAISARHRLALTGTPLENRQLDLWSLFRFLMPGLLGSREVFEGALADDRDKTLAAMRAQVGPFLLRRTKDEVAAELPPKVHATLSCPLTERQRLEYARICSEGLNRLGSDLRVALKERTFGVFSLLTRLRQVCCDPGLLPWVEDEPGASGKIGLLVEKLTEVFAGGHKVVIFSQFVSLLKRAEPAVRAAFPAVPLFEITGATLDRKKPVQSFQEAVGAAAMFVSLKAAGTGITLHAADYVFLLDPWWNPAVEEQAIDRVHRIGQTRTVFVYRMITPGTIEERIQALQAGKRELFRQVVDGLPASLDLASQFQSLEHLIALRDEAVTSGET